MPTSVSLPEAISIWIFPDGCTLDYVAPEVIVIEPGHDGRVIGDVPAVVIEFDFVDDTAARLGLPAIHQHGK
jgi:hypothetical protein